MSLCVITGSSINSDLRDGSIAETNILTNTVDYVTYSQQSILAPLIEFHGCMTVVLAEIQYTNFKCKLYSCIEIKKKNIYQEISKGPEPEPPNILILPLKERIFIHRLLFF